MCPLPNSWRKHILMFGKTKKLVFNWKCKNKINRYCRSSLTKTTSKYQIHGLLQTVNHPILKGQGVCCSSFTCLQYDCFYVVQAAGGFLIYVGVEFLLSAGSLNEISWKPPIIIFSTAAVILIGGIVGCYGVYSQKKACLSIVSHIF